MIVSTLSMVFLCCRPRGEVCTKMDYAEAAQHARERAFVAGWRQRVSRWRPPEGVPVWLIVTLPQEVKPATWEFDGTVYKIVNTQS